MLLLDSSPVAAVPSKGNAKRAYYGVSVIVPPLFPRPPHLPNTNVFEIHLPSIPGTKCDSSSLTIAQTFRQNRGMFLCIYLIARSTLTRACHVRPKCPIQMSRYPVLLPVSAVVHTIYSGSSTYRLVQIPFASSRPSLLYQKMELVVIYTLCFIRRLVTSPWDKLLLRYELISGIRDL